MIKKILIALGVITLLIGAFFALRFYTGNPRLMIINEGDTDIKAVEVLVSGNNYTLDDIAAGDKRTLRINPEWDSSIKLIINKKDTLLIGAYLDQSSTGGYIKAHITEDSLISFKYKRGLL